MSENTKALCTFTTELGFESFSDIFKDMNCLVERYSFLN